MEPWKTAITHWDETHIWVRGQDITTLMRNATFTEVAFLLYQGRLPTPQECRLLDAILISVADHGPGSPSAAASRIVASGNRQAPEAAIAAGILAVGDAHAGAGLACMQMIKDGLDLAKRESISVSDAARRIVEASIEEGKRLAGFGHRNHSTDPRTILLFDLAQELKLNGAGIEFLQAAANVIREKIKPLPINVDGALAAILHDLGFPPLFGKLIFIVGRVAGLAAQVMEEYTREKPMRIRIPVQYDGKLPELPE
ncbi:MAG: citryl-CoA lyase [Acidobacteria bacterium]|nr:citryl-CoA lyase [Acidobacteriota bacterium]